MSLSQDLSYAFRQLARHRVYARTTGIGLVLGILLSIALSDWVQRWTESSMRDASVLGSIAAVFLLASAIASLLPARRSTRIDPMIALRDN